MGKRSLKSASRAMKNKNDNGSDKLFTELPRRKVCAIQSTETLGMWRQSSSSFNQLNRRHLLRIN